MSTAVAEVYFAGKSILNHLIKAIAFFSVYTGNAIVSVDTGNLPFGSGSDFFGIIQLLCFKAALLFFFLGADATVGSHA